MLIWKNLRILESGNYQGTSLRILESRNYQDLISGYDQKRYKS